MVRTACSPTDREALHARVCQYADEYLDACGRAGLDLHAVEVAHEKVMARIGEALNGAGVDDAMAQPLVCHCPQCGRFLGYHDTQEKGVMLTSGEARLKEGRYRCSRCQKDFRPVSVLNDLEDTGYTLGARQKIVETATAIAFAPTSAAVRPPVVVSAKKVEAVVAEGARWLREEQRQGIAAYLGDRGKPGQQVSIRPGWLVTQWQEKDLPAGAVLGITMDGAKIRGKERDEDGKLRWLEGRAATFSVSVDGQELPLKESGGKIYLAGKVDVDELFEWMCATHAALPGQIRSLPTAITGDDGPWWERAKEHFPQAVQVLDVYHAGEVLGRAAGLCFGESTTRAKEWRQHAREWLQQEGRQEELIAALRAALSEARLRLDETGYHDAELAIAYLERNKERMRYWEFRAMGLPISSGVAESAVKQTVIARCRQAGMMWREDHADDILRLRGAMLSRELPALYQRRREACLKRARRFNEGLQLAA
jgi:hypothetical protein